MLTKAPEPELQDIDGRSLSYRLRHAPLHRRTALAEGLVTGKTRIDRFTRTQAAAICGVPLPIVNKAVNGRKKPEPQDCVTWWREASFGDRVDFVRACGVAEVWDSLSTAVA